MSSESGRLQGRGALITGGASGIGLAAAELFVAEGARVAICDLDPGGEEVARRLREEGGEAVFVAADVTDAVATDAAVAAAREQLGELQVVYANAGLTHSGTPEETDPESWDRVIAVNLTGQFNIVRSALPALREAGGGSIILTASEVGIMGARNSAAYCAAKGGVVNLARALAVDCAGDRIRVNCLAPGATETPMLREWMGEEPVGRGDMHQHAIPLGRLAAATEIARVALFLASSDSSYVTGSVQVADGGVTCWSGV